ncbi:MAG: peptide-binding protein [Nitrospinota bacterium]|nr:peptide-binding protein [Nitrospinota bacterium]
MRILAVALALFLTSACQPKPVGNGKSSSQKPAEISTTPEHGGMLVEASIGDASNLIAMLAGDAASHSISGLVNAGLVRYTPSWEIEGELAESFEISNGGKTITFHLRKGVKWHDGHPFTSADVMFGYKTIINENTPTAYSEDYLQVSKAEAPDDHTFIVHYDKPFAPALGSWGSLTVLPKHLLEGKDITKSELTRKPIGVGPYKFIEWKTQEKIVLEANPEYFEGEPFIKRYVFRIIPDTATQFLELKSNGIDMMGLTPIQYKKQANTSFFNENFQKYSYLANGYVYMGYNLKRKLFQDVRVRRAITHAIDKDEIIEGALLGLGKPAEGPYKPGIWAYNPNVKKLGYDPEKAKSILAEAGWKDTDGDGILDKDGKKFEFTIVTNQGNDQRKKTAEIIQRRLKEVGIAVNIRIIEWASFIKEFINKREFDATILGWSLSPDPDNYDIWHSSKTKEAEFNFISYKNDEVDALLEKGRRSFDQEERKKAYYRIQEILAEEQPYCFLFNSESLPVVSARVKGITAYPTGIGYRWPNLWWIPKSLQRYQP